MEEPLKVYQLKEIIRQYLEATNKQLVYKSKKKKELLDIIDKERIKIYDYEFPKYNPNPKMPTNILKKFGTRANNAEEQKFFIDYTKDEKFNIPKSSFEKFDKNGYKIYGNELNMQEHQLKFIKQFVYSNLQGAIMFHGVGSGKTLTAVISSYLYLKLYPNNKVIVISPSALLYNFIQSMDNFGIGISDNRYIFTTYDKYIRKPTIAKNALLIVDEAQNLRTELNIVDTYDPETGELLEAQSNTNQKGYKIWKYGAMYADKILLLTGTAFVNTIYDIENLLAMIDKREPHSRDLFTTVISSPNNITDYFSHKISYYESPKSNLFPEITKDKNQIVPLYMTSEMENKYEYIKRNGRNKSKSKNPNSFYSAEKFASNTIVDKDGYNPKFKWCLDEIIKKPNQKFIVYSGLMENGINILKALLKSKNIEYKEITGNETPLQKEQSKLYFNYYDFGKKDFFSKSIIDPNYYYINDKYRVLLITKAGAEGVDTKNCQNLVILDHQWNDATSEQIIARAVRYKSHFQLPEKERYVNIYRLFLCKKSDEKIIKKIQEGDYDFTKMNSYINTERIKQLENLHKEENNYLSSVSELKGLKIPIYTDAEIKNITEKMTTGSTASKKLYKNLYGKNKLKENKLFIPQYSQYKHVRGRFKQKSSISITEEGWDIYNKLNTEKEKKEWRIKMYARWFNSYGNPEKKESYEDNFSVSIDLKLYILSKSKQENINSFIKYFGNNIKLFESYESKLIKLVVEKEQKLKKSLTEEEQANIYIDLLKNEREDLKKIILENTRKSKMLDKAKRLQQYFTSDELVKEMIQYSNIDEIKTNIQILEPTAGDGRIVEKLAILKKDINIDMCEIDVENRKKLMLLTNNHKNILNLLDYRNFLTFIPSKRYDFIFMNPPFHIKKSSNALLKHDIFDFDFVKRAYAMLKIGGTLIAITYKHWSFTKDMNDWMISKNVIYDKNPDKCENVKEIKDAKFSENVKLDILLLKILKEDDSEDKSILEEKFYNNERKDNIIGELILNNEEDFTKLKENKKYEKPLKVESLNNVFKAQQEDFNKTKQKIKDFRNKNNEFTKNYLKIDDLRKEQYKYREKKQKEKDTMQTKQMYIDIRNRRNEVKNFISKNKESQEIIKIINDGYEKLNNKIDDNMNKTDKNIFGRTDKYKTDDIILNMFDAFKKVIDKKDLKNLSKEEIYNLIDSAHGNKYGHPSSRDIAPIYKKAFKKMASQLYEANKKIETIETIKQKDLLNLIDKIDKKELNKGAEKLRKIDEQAIKEYDFKNIKKKKGYDKRGAIIEPVEEDENIIDIFKELQKEEAKTEREKFKEEVKRDREEYFKNNKRTGKKLIPYSERRKNKLTKKQQLQKWIKEAGEEQKEEKKNKEKIEKERLKEEEENNRMDRYTEEQLNNIDKKYSDDAKKAYEMKVAYLQNRYGTLMSNEFIASANQIKKYLEDLKRNGYRRY